MKKSLFLFIVVSMTLVSLRAQTLFVPSGTSGINSSTTTSVGIGRNDPVARLDIQGTTSDSTAWVLWARNSGGNAVFAVRNDGYLTLGPGAGPDQFVKTAEGNVGIGTTNPTHKLSVNGTIRAKEVIVDTGWSDYVFAPDYKLAPLSEVETHIKQNGHLPGIPSAKEVAEHGVSMGEMQAKLLAKIEELTLHQIEQEKHQRAQEQEIKQLKAQITELR